ASANSRFSSPSVSRVSRSAASAPEGSLLNRARRLKRWSTSSEKRLGLLTESALAGRSRSKSWGGVGAGPTGAARAAAERKPATGTRTRRDRRSHAGSARWSVMLERQRLPGRSGPRNLSQRGLDVLPQARVVRSDPALVEPHDLAVLAHEVLGEVPAGELAR